MSIMALSVICGCLLLGQAGSSDTQQAEGNKLIIAVDRELMVKSIFPGSQQQGKKLSFDGVGVVDRHRYKEMEYSPLVGIYENEKLASAALCSRMTSICYGIPNDDGPLALDRGFIEHNAFYVRNRNLVIGCYFHGKAKLSTEEFQAAAQRALSAMKDEATVKVGPKPATPQITIMDVAKLATFGGKTHPRAFYIDIKTGNGDDILLQNDHHGRGRRISDDHFAVTASRNAQELPLELKLARKTGEVAIVTVDQNTLKSTTKAKEWPRGEDKPKSQPASGPP